MQTYRVYFVENDGHINSPPIVVEAADDQIAISMAQQLVDGRAIDLWQADRLVAKFPATTVR